MVVVPRANPVFVSLDTGVESPDCGDFLQPCRDLNSGLQVLATDPGVIMLAATAIEHDLYLATRNVKDVRETGAAIFDPWHDDPAAFPLAR